MLIDYIDGTLNAEERALVEQELKTDTDAKILLEQLQQVMGAMHKSKELQPSARLRKNFEAMLRSETAQAGGRVVKFQPLYYRVAASVALLITATLIGFWVYQTNQHNKEMAALRKEMEDTKSMMLTMINNDLSASQRIQGVSVANTIQQVDDEVTIALMKTLNEDPNTNVRLAALEALSRFVNEPPVKASLIKSLAVQKDPMVQIALIQLLVRIKETTILPELKNIIDNDQSIKAVKDEAYTALLKLS